MGERHDIWEIVDRMQMDIRALSVRMVELRAQLAAIDLPKPNELVCHHAGCGLKFKGPNTLAEHLRVSHDGPLPPAWARAEAISDEPPDDDEPELGEAGSVP